MKKPLFTNLKAHSEHRTQALQLIEKSFNYTPPNRFEVDFYPLMAPTNHQHCHILLEDDRVLAHMAVKLKTFTIDTTTYRSGFLGGICVSPERRGQGLLKKLFQEVFQHYQDKGVCFWFLWSDQSSLYERFDFYELGEIVMGGQELNHSLLKNHHRLCWRDLSAVQFERVKQLYQQTWSDYLIPERTNEDWEEMAKIESVDLYFNHSSYFCLNKGQDLQGIIHEWGAEKPELVIQQFANAPLWHMPKEVSQLPHLFVGLMRIGDHELFRDFISKWSQSRLQIDQSHQKSILFSFDGVQHQLSIKDFLTGLWGPQTIKEFDGLGPKFFISGLESV